MEIPSDLLDHPIAFQRAYVRVTGSIGAALMLSQAVYWQRRTRSADGFFWKTSYQWEDETGLTRREQDGARVKLRDLGILQEEKRGVPQKTFFHIHFDVIAALLCTKPPTCVHDSCTDAQDHMHQSANLYAPNRQPITETTQRLQKPSSPKTPSPSQQEDSLPDWIDLAAWRAFTAMRQRMKPKADTANALELVLKKLAEMHARGIDTNAVLEESVMNGWIGVFEPKGQSNGAGQAGNKFTRTAASLAIVLAGIDADATRNGAGNDGLLPRSRVPTGVPRSVQPALIPRAPAGSARSLSPPRRAASA